jgi:hypothetical protein
VEIDRIRSSIDKVGVSEEKTIFHGLLLSGLPESESTSFF